MRDIIINCVDKVSLMQKEYFLNKIIDIAENSIWYLESKPLSNLRDLLEGVIEKNTKDLREVIAQMNELGLDTSWTVKINKRLTEVKGNEKSIIGNR